MTYFSNFLIDYFELEQSDADSILNHYVHADIHNIQFIPGSSDEVLFATDGGVQFTAEMSMSDENLIGDRLPVYPSFYHINNSLTTTQYYTLALHPSHGNNEAMGGTQDNSTHLSVPDEKISYDDLISGGDGAYCFYDSDDPNLKITSSHVNNYNFIVDGK
jgi:hypothetical protein